MDFELPPDEITSLLKIMPTRTWRTGDLKQEKSILRHSERGWELGSELPASNALGEHFKHLTDALVPSFEVLGSFGAKWTKHFACALYYPADEPPELSLDSDTLRAIANLQASLDIDLYAL